MTSECFSLTRWMMTIGFLVLAPSVSQAQSPFVKSANMIANSVDQFSNVQGKDGWYYGYWDRSMDADGKYNQDTEFTRFDQFGEDARNGLNKHDGFTTGDLWYKEDGRLYTSLWANGGHANRKIPFDEPAAEEQWAIRRWISDVSGTVSISGTAGKLMPWGTNWRGECQAIIIVDGETVLSTVMDEQGVEYEVAVKLHKDSVVDFLIAPHPSIGVVTFTATIQKRASVKDSKR